MILADKIIRLRKKNGWSQEELADKMNISRQAVSKWEGAQAMPDLDKILQLAALFGVTTDYLLKDELEDEEYTSDTEDGTIKRVSLEDAHKYLFQRKTAAKKIAFATLLLILSPITLLIMGAMSEMSVYGITETVANIVGIVVILVFAACAVAIYIDCGFKNKPFAFLNESEPYELEYGVRGMVKEQQERYRNTYVRGNIIATCLCILAVIPLICVSFSTENVLLEAAMLCVLFAVESVAVSLFIVVGVRNESMEKLLQEGDYTAKNKRKGKIVGNVSGIYWGIVITIYFAWSFLASAWKISWVLLVVGSLLFPVVLALFDVLYDRKNKK